MAAEKKTAPGVNGGGADKQKSFTDNIGENGTESKASPHKLPDKLPDCLAPLIALPRWVIWKLEPSPSTGKLTKIPYQAKHPNRKANSTDPSTWCDFATAWAASDKGDGIGFCLFDSEISAFDIDDCRNKSTGIIDPWVKAFVERVGSYTEITISGQGLHIIGYGKGPKVHSKYDLENGVQLECYRKAERYIVMTGDFLEGATPLLVNIDERMDEIVAQLDKRKKANGEGTKDDESGEDKERDELRELLRTCRLESHPGDRSRAVWRAILIAYRLGYLPNTIRPWLLDKRNRISDHIYDQTDPSAYTDRQFARARAEIDFERSEKDKKVLPTQVNVHVALLNMRLEPRYNQLSTQIEISNLPPEFAPRLEDDTFNHIRLEIRRLFKFEPNDLRAILVEVGRLNGYHPICDYLDGLRWDGVERVENWLNIYCGTPDSEYTREVGKLVLVAAVRRVRKPGCKFDEMLVMESSQGTDKSSAVQALVPNEDWFSDSLQLATSTQRAVEATQGKWIIEAAELSGLKQGDIENLKAYLSRQVDRVRMAYARTVSNAPRQFIIIGTTNADEYLKDTTGNRRYWPVRIAACDTPALRRDRDQLWAEAAELERSGMSIRLDPRYWGTAAEEQEKRLTGDPYYDALQAKLVEYEGQKVKITSESVWVILDVKTGMQNQDNKRRMGDAMRKLSWTTNTAGQISVPLVTGQGKTRWENVAGWMREDSGPHVLLKAERDKDAGVYIVIVNENIKPGGEPM